MKPVTAQWIANAVGGTVVADVDVRVTSVDKDSRAMQPGGMYVAIRGERVDGHDFVDDAMSHGAVLSLVQEPVAGPHIMVDDVVHALGELARAYLADLRLGGNLTVMGVTGSNGKTTTKDMVSQALPDVVAPQGSYNNEIGLPLTVLRADQSTRTLMLEMGASGVGHIDYLTSIAPLDVAAVLMVGSAHLGQYDSLAQVAQAKAEIVAGVVPGGTVILNADDPAVMGMVSSVPEGCDVITFSTVDGTVTATDLTQQEGYARFGLRVAGELVSEPRPLSVLGMHHVGNALAAICLAHAAGAPWEQAHESVARARIISQHRMALTQRRDGVTIIDDAYNASLESVKAALHTVRSVATQGRSIAVLGEILELGDAAVQVHSETGQLAVRLGIDHVLAVGDGTKPLYDAVVREGSWGEEAAWVATMEDARDHLNSMLRPGDTVVIKASHGTGLWALASQLLEDHT